MNDETEKEQTLGKQEFGVLIGRSPSYVTMLIKQGRIALTADGRRVFVAQSLALIDQTKGTRDDVAARHAANRAGDGATQGAGEKAAARDPAVAAALNSAAQSKALNEARRVAAAADREEMERDMLAKSLVPREEAEHAMKFIGAAMRSLMDVFPDQVAPLVAPITDLNEVQSILADRCRGVLTDFVDVIERQQKQLAEDK